MEIKILTRDIRLKNITNSISFFFLAVVKTKQREKMNKKGNVYQNSQSILRQCLPPTSCTIEEIMNILLLFPPMPHRTVAQFLFHTTLKLRDGKLQQPYTLLRSLSSVEESIS
jgi:hypothetical protein